MKNYFYYNVTRKATIQLMDMLNDIKILRYHEDGSVRKYINVPLKFAPKQKEYMWLRNKNKQFVVPQIALNLTNIDYSSERQVNKHEYIVKSESPSAGELDKFLNPVPYDITYELSIYAINIDDIYQIVEQILPYFSPNAWFTIRIPQIGSILNLKVIYQGSSPDMPLELSDNMYRVLKWDMTFLVQAYYFTPLEQTKLIKRILENIYLNEDNFDDRSTDTIYTSGAPVSGAQQTYDTWTNELNRESSGNINYTLDIFEEG